ncbi:MAG: ribonuclease HII [Alphaproteobacteria bacterium]|jgi:ribonuclease HII|nr:ribonuclease HII [Rhodospirillaceae bacterium]MDP6403660.1 ribonuclease HII [Alphaproteobacteria bacterium]
MPDLSLEAAAGGVVAGVDEAGRGPWAGPVVAAAVILDTAHLPPGIDDSKRLKRSQREHLAAAIRASARVGLGTASVIEIDDLNILAATLLAMRRAVDNLPMLPDLALVDGNRAPELACTVRTVVKGDALSLSIAAASIIAKVGRDAMMAELDKDCPGYGWRQNAGYGTAQHRAALDRLGPTVHHRRSFAPVRRALDAARENSP